jgi:hypothetical protein
MGYVIKPVLAQGPTIVEVPDEVAKDLEELFAHLTANPGQLALAEFDTPEEKVAFVKQARSWASTHEPVLEYRQSPSTGLAATALKFNIRTPLTDEQKAELKRRNEEAKAKREAKAAADAKSAAKK